MEIANISSDDKLHHFLEEFGNNQVKRALLFFWGRHSKARFSSNVICNILDCSKLEAERVLKAMVKEGLLENHISDNIKLYSLTTNEDKRRPILELAALDWDQQNNIIRHLRLRNTS